MAGMTPISISDIFSSSEVTTRVRRASVCECKDPLRSSSNRRSTDTWSPPRTINSSVATGDVHSSKRIKRASSTTASSLKLSQM